MHSHQQPDYRLPMRQVYQNMHGAFPRFPPPPIFPRPTSIPNHALAHRFDYMRARQLDTRLESSFVNAPSVFPTSRKQSRFKNNTKNESNDDNLDKNVTTTSACPDHYEEKIEQYTNFTSTDDSVNFRKRSQETLVKLADIIPSFLAFLKEQETENELKQAEASQFHFPEGSFDDFSRHLWRRRHDLINRFPVSMHFYSDDNETGNPTLFYMIGVDRIMDWRWLIRSIAVSSTELEPLNQPKAGDDCIVSSAGKFLRARIIGEGNPREDSSSNYSDSSLDSSAGRNMRVLCVDTGEILDTTPYKFIEGEMSIKPLRGLTIEEVPPVARAMQLAEFNFDQSELNDQPEEVQMALISQFYEFLHPLNRYNSSYGDFESPKEASHRVLIVGEDAKCGTLKVKFIADKHKDLNDFCCMQVDCALAPKLKEIMLKVEQVQSMNERAFDEMRISRSAKTH